MMKITHPFAILAWLILFLLFPSPLWRPPRPGRFRQTRRENTETVMLMLSGNYWLSLPTDLCKTGIRGTPSWPVCKTFRNVPDRSGKIPE